MTILELFRILRNYEYIIIEHNETGLYKGLPGHIPMGLMDNHVNKIYPAEHIDGDKGTLCLVIEV